MSQPLPEVHIIGEIVSGHGFSGSNAFAKYSMKSGSKWDCVCGEESDQTQTDYPRRFSSDFVWNHPLDFHYFISSMQGWPQIVFEVGNLDEYGGKQVFGFGVSHLPTSSGIHEIECPIWRVVGSTLEEAYSFFLDITPSLRDTNLISNTLHLQHRHKICTLSVGKIKIKISVLLRNFEKFNLEWE